MMGSEYQLETLTDAKRAAYVRNMNFEAVCREIGRITGAMISTSDHRSIRGDKLSNPMRAALGLYFFAHDMIFEQGKEPPNE